ncbi:MAG TPA: hypothetical protein VLE69_00745 [Candidatus Saccharimonadales bacterium]|nr:hypothetical protein [Candidatus Saccharimonadales bacterium]
MDEAQPPNQQMNAGQTEETHDASVHQIHPEHAGVGINERLTAIGINPSGLVPETEYVADQAAKTEAREQEAKVLEWQELVDGVRKDLAYRRDQEEARLRTDFNRGYIRTEELAAKRLSQIDEAIARGAMRSKQYSGGTLPGGSMFEAPRLYQTYYESVDEQGNIWREYESVNPRDGAELTGNPEPVGKRMYMENPTLPPQASEEQTAS